MSARAGEFRRELLPSWETYAKQHDIALRGPGDQKRTRCTIHGGERESFVVNTRTGAWQCKSCNATGADVLAHYRAVHGCGFVEAARDLGAWIESDAPMMNRPAEVRRSPVATFSEPDPAKDADQLRKIALAARVFAQSLCIEPPTPAGQYHAARCCVLPPIDSDLRWLPDLRLFGFSGPALVGRMSLAVDHRQTRGLHLTWLRQVDGTWQRGERRYLGPKAGCVVRLWPDEAVTTGLGVAEGIETALSLAHAMAPVWAALDAGNLAAFPVLEGIECLTIAADNDDAGIAAARACAARWAHTGRDVRLAMPNRHKADLNDVARAAA